MGELPLSSSGLRDINISRDNELWSRQW